MVWISFSPAPVAQHAPRNGVRLGSLLHPPCQISSRAWRINEASAGTPERFGRGAPRPAHMALMFISSSFGTRYFSSVSKHNTLTYSLIYVKGWFQRLFPSHWLPGTYASKRRWVSPPGSDLDTIAAVPRRFNYSSLVAPKKSSFFVF